MAKRNEKRDAPECDKSCKPIELPTDEELEALNAMRAIKGRAREMKKRLSELTSSSRAEDKDEVRALESELEKLKMGWNEWEEKRREAAKQRMILLGHEEE
jgi:hypothetical protein